MAKVEEEERMDVDSILLEEVGHFGKFQLRTIVPCLMVVFFVGWTNSEYFFTSARTNSRCFIEECESAEPEWSPWWVQNAVPTTGGTADSCARYAPTGNNSGTCSADMFDQNLVVSCQRSVYENTHSIAYEFDLGCDEWRRSLVGTFHTLGVMLALPISGVVSDHWGRRVALSISAFNIACIGVLKYFATSYWMFTLMKLAESTFGGGGFTCAYILFMEVVSPKHRVLAGVMVNMTYATSQILLGLIVWALPNWRTLTLTIYIPQVLTFAHYWIILESIRWLLSKERYAEAERVLKTGAKLNGKVVTDKSLETLRAAAEILKKQKEIEASERASEPWLVILVFRSRPMIIRCIVAPVWWMTMTFVYYGLSLNAVNMSGNPYINYIAVSAVEIPGYLVAYFFIDRIGRKPVLIGAYWMCAACQLAYLLIPSDLESASLALYLIGKCSIAMVVTALYVYTAELYPTRYRQSLFGFSSMMGRVGSMLAPLTPALGASTWDGLPFVLFASMSLLSGLLLFLTPETMGKQLPETMAQASELSNVNIKPRTVNTNL